MTTWTDTPLHSSAWTVVPDSIEISYIEDSYIQFGYFLDSTYYTDTPSHSTSWSVVSSPTTSWVSQTPHSTTWV